MRSALIALLLLALALAPGFAQDVPTGTVVGASSGLEGTYNVSFPSVAGLQIRDVFTVVRGGKPVGEAMALSIDPATNTVSITGLASFQGKMLRGDSVVFARHDAVPVTAPPPQPQGPPVIGDVPPPPAPQSAPDPYDINAMQPGDVSAPLDMGVPYYYYPWYHDGAWGPTPSNQPYYPHDTFRNAPAMGVPGAAPVMRAGGGRR